MLTITDLNGNEEALVGLSGLNRKRGINAERQLTFKVFPLPQNQHSYEMVQAESKIEFDGDVYIAKKVIRGSMGNSHYKEVLAYQGIYGLNDSYKYEVHNGSLTFRAALEFILSGTGYTYEIVDAFFAKDWENFGDDTRLNLLSNAVSRYGAEFSLVDKHLTFKHKIGNRSDFQFRYGHNIKMYSDETSTANLSTYIKGYGDEGIEAEYISPNAYLFPTEDSPDGLRHAPVVRDERYKSSSTLLERLKEDIVDIPEVSITIDFADMRRAGYAYDVPNEGDDVFIFYEPLKIEVEARIVEVEETFNDKLEPTETKVTLANVTQNLGDFITSLKGTQKQVDNLFKGKERLPYSVLDEAVRMATEAIQSAQTELVFDNGILAFEKPNPNEVVILNSKGLGISRNGGQTLTTAITSRGVVAETIVGGSIIGINLASDNGLGTFHVSGSDAEFTSPSGTMKMNPDGIYSFNKNGTTKFQADSFLVTSRALGTTTANVYIAAQSGKEARAVDMKDVPSDGEIGSYTYIPVRGQGFYGNYLEANAGEPGFNVYIRPRNGGEVRVTGANTTDVYYPLRASTFYGSSFVSTTSSAWIGTDSFLHVVAKGSAEGSLDPIYRDLRAARIYGTGFVTSSTHAYIGSDDEVRFQNKGLSGIYRNARANLYYGNGVEVNGGTNLYLRPSSGGEVQVTAAGTTDSYKTIRAAGFVEASSQDYKTDITPWNYDALSVIRNETQIYQYKMISDVEQGNSFYRRGVIVERETPAEFINGKGISHYEMLNFAVRSLQQLGDKFDDLDYRVTKLEGAS